MSCLCAANTLRLFVRSLVQVDVPASTIHVSRQSTRGGPLIRGPSTARTLRQLHSTPARLDSTQSPHTKDDVPSEKAASTTSTEETKPEKPVAKKSAFAEISLESIDEIVAESDAQDIHYTTSPDSSRVLKSTGERSKPTNSDTIFRRTKVQSTGLAIHYSSPPAPPRAKPRVRRDFDGTEAEETKRSTHSPRRDDWTPPPREHWQLDKQALKEKFPEGWSPRRRLSPDALAGIRAVHAQMPGEFTTRALAERFEVSPEAIRRILKSKWSPNADEETDRQRRWFNRGMKIYEKHDATGQKAPKKWREAGIGKTKAEWVAVKQKRAGLHKRAPLPALVTTAKRPVRTTFGQKGGDSLSSRIL